MTYPFKYPELYGELARQGKSKKDLAEVLGITTAGLRWKQDPTTTADFGGEEIKIASKYLGRPAEFLFGFGDQQAS